MFVYPILFVGILSHGLLVHYRAWRGSASTVSLKRRLVVSVFGALTSLTLGLVGYVWGGFIAEGAIADPQPAIIYRVLGDYRNVAYLGVGFAVGPTLVLVRAVLSEVRD